MLRHSTRADGARRPGGVSALKRSRMAGAGRGTVRVGHTRRVCLHTPVPPNAFYTSPKVIEEMWAGLDAMGELREHPVLRVLEPAACSGRFLTHQPPHLSAKSEHTAVELDTLSAGLLSHVLSEYSRRTSYPDAFVWDTCFQSAPLERGQHRRGPRVSLQYLHHQWVPDASSIGYLRLGMV